MFWFHTESHFKWTEFMLQLCKFFSLTKDLPAGCSTKFGRSNEESLKQPLDLPLLFIQMHKAPFLAIVSDLTFLVNIPMQIFHVLCFQAPTGPLASDVIGCMHISQIFNALCFQQQESGVCQCTPNVYLLWLQQVNSHWIQWAWRVFYCTAFYQAPLMLEKQGCPACVCLCVCVLVMGEGQPHVELLSTTRLAWACHAATQWCACRKVVH